MCPYIRIYTRTHACTWTDVSRERELQTDRQIESARQLVAFGSVTRTLSIPFSSALFLSFSFHSSLFTNPDFRPPCNFRLSSIIFNQFYTFFLFWYRCTKLFSINLISRFFYCCQVTQELTIQDEKKDLLCSCHFRKNNFISSLYVQFCIILDLL